MSTPSDETREAMARWQKHVEVWREEVEGWERRREDKMLLKKEVTGRVDRARFGKTRDLSSSELEDLQRQIKNRIEQRDQYVVALIKLNSEKSEPWIISCINRLQALNTEIGLMQGEIEKQILLNRREEKSDASQPEKGLVGSEQVKEEIQKQYAKLISRAGLQDLKGMTKEEFSRFKEDIADLISKAEGLLKKAGIPIPADLLEIGQNLDHLKGRVVAGEKARNGFVRAYYALAGDPKPELGGKYWLQSKKQELEDKIKEERAKLDTEWQQKIHQRFEAAPDSTAATKAGFEGRRWGATYMLSPAEAEELKRKKEAYDQVRATKAACESMGLTVQGHLETVKYVVRSTAGVARETVEEGVVSGGKALLVGFGGPAVAAVILARDVFFDFLGTKVPNVLAAGSARADSYLENRISDILGKVETNNDGSVKWSGASGPKNVGRGVVHTVVRAFPWAGKYAASGVSAVSHGINRAIDAGIKKNIIPILGIGGTVVGAYFLTITLASVFTLGIPLAITAVGLGCAVIGAGLATYMRAKSTAKEAIDMKLSPEEELMLMRHDYEQQKKAFENKPSADAKNAAQIAPGQEPDAASLKAPAAGQHAQLSQQMSTVHVLHHEVHQQREALHTQEQRLGSGVPKEGFTPHASSTSDRDRDHKEGHETVMGPDDSGPDTEATTTKPDKHEPPKHQPE